VVVIVENKGKKQNKTTPMNIVSVVYINQKTLLLPSIAAIFYQTFLSKQSMIIGIFAKQKWPILIAEKCDE